MRRLRGTQGQVSLDPAQEAKMNNEALAGWGKSSGPMKNRPGPQCHAWDLEEYPLCYVFWASLIAHLSKISFAILCILSNISMALNRLL